MASSSTATPATNLATRYARLSDGAIQVSLEEARVMPLTQLGQVTVSFGTKVRGRTYEDVAQSETSWVKWCLEHLADSTKHSHRLFIIYMERFVSQSEELEADLMMNPVTGDHEPQPSRSKPTPKSKAGAKPATVSEDDRWDMVATRSAVQHVEGQVNVLSDRMTHLEGMLQQVLHHLQTSPENSVARDSAYREDPNDSQSTDYGSNRTLMVAFALQVLNYFQGLSTKTYVTTAAWQRGRLERHGDILKDMLSRLDLESPIINDVIFDQVLQQAVLAKNSLVRHSGFSPEQIVFGKSLRLPGSNVSDEDSTAHALAEGADLESEAFRQKLDIRCKARRAFLEADNSQAIRRATLRRSNPVRGPFEAGMWVLYWVKKSSPNRLAAGRWHGPAKVVCREGSSIVWLAHGTNIIRAAPENLRPASLREWQHLTDSSLGESSWKNVGGASSFIDVTGASDSSTPASVPVPTGSSGDTTVMVPTVLAPSPNLPAPQGPSEELGQPEQELTPQVSQEVAEVERESPLDTAAPSAPADVTGEMPAPPLGNEVSIKNLTKVLKSRWILTWKAPEEHTSMEPPSKRAKVTEPKRVFVVRHGEEAKAAVPPKVTSSLRVILFKSFMTEFQSRLQKIEHVEETKGLIEQEWLYKQGDELMWRYLARDATLQRDIQHPTLEPVSHATILQSVQTLLEHASDQEPLNPDTLKPNEGALII
ncbi:unnamed protein product [Symbiodinium sp. KB8]|nr:unnamed protein product [Symbiodinium sp. KB8]